MIVITECVKLSYSETHFYIKSACFFLLCTAVQESNLTVVLVVTVMKLHGNPSEDGTKHNVLDNAQPISFCFFLFFK